MTIKKILVIRFSSIGDIVLTSPVVRCLKNQTGAQIHFLVKKAYADVIKGSPYIDRIHFFEDTQKSLAVLKMEKFDLIVDLQKNLKSSLISIKLRSKTITFDKLNIKKWLKVNLKIDLLPKNKHLVDRYFDALKEVNVVNDGAGLDYFISETEKESAKAYVLNDPYQVLVLGATYFTKRIPEEKCMEIIQKYPFKTLLLGGKDVAELAKKLESPFPDKVLNLSGGISLGVSAAIIQLCQRIVTGDTGLMHMAAAFQKDMVVIWGNTIPEFGMFPYFGNKSKPNHLDLQVSDLSCRPCSKLGFHQCPKGHFNCMNHIKIP